MANERVTLAKPRGHEPVAAVGSSQRDFLAEFVTFVRFALADAPHFGVKGTVTRPDAFTEKVTLLERFRVGMQIFAPSSTSEQNVVVVRRYLVDDRRNQKGIW